MHRDVARRTPIDEELRSVVIGEGEYAGRCRQSDTGCADEKDPPQSPQRSAPERDRAVLLLRQRVSTSGALGKGNKLLEINNATARATDLLHLVGTLPHIKNGYQLPEAEFQDNFSPSLRFRIGRPPKESGKFIALAPEQRGFHARFGPQARGR